MTTLSRNLVFLVTIFVWGCVSQPTTENMNNTDPETSAENAAQVADNDATESDPDELICTREQVTGSNFRRRVCLTRAERLREQADSQEELLERRSSVRVAE